jgi:hypothetical protein
MMFRETTEIVLILVSTGLQSMPIRETPSFSHSGFQASGLFYPPYILLNALLTYSFSSATKTNDPSYSYNRKYFPADYAPGLTSQRYISGARTE